MRESKYRKKNPNVNYPPPKGSGPVLNGSPTALWQGGLHPIT